MLIYSHKQLNLNKRLLDEEIKNNENNSFP